MIRSWVVRAASLFSVAALMSLAAVSDSLAQPLDPSLQSVVMPPLSAARSAYFRNHPTEWAQFLSQLPRRPVGAPKPSAAMKGTFTGGTWQAVTTLPSGSLCNPLLLTDGTVMVADCDTPNWYKLAPDITGNYANGTWTQIASLPSIGGTQYAPQYHASGVLPDGRVIIMGGEYNGGNTEVWTKLGAIYNPVSNTWKAVSAPSGWTEVGDAASIVLANGTFMLAGCCNSPDADALLNAKTLTWTTTGAPSAGGNYQDEQGYELLPSGNVLTIDVWTNYPSGGATNAEQYSPTLGTWSSAGNTPVSLVDPSKCGNWEIGPAVLRPDGKMIAFGGNSGCVNPKADPIAIYDTTAGTWTAAPYVQAACPATKVACDLADAPAALLPDGNILYAASPGYGKNPTHFFEFTTGNFNKQVSDPLFFASDVGAYYYNFLVLPSGQIFSTDFSNIAEIYTPSGTPVASWAPFIGSVPTALTACKTYILSGQQLSGLSQGAAYGDDVQAATNYPIVKIVNSTTGHVFYARTSSFTSLSVAPMTKSATLFTVPGTVETGPSSLYAIANGIQSKPVSVTMINLGGC
jgi:hypothetical protein